MTAEASQPVRRSWPRRLGRAAGVLAAVLGVAIAALLVLLATAADRAIVARRFLDLANAQFAGRIDLQQAWYFPDGHFYARDVTIRGPDGEVIIRAATVETHVDLLALAGKRLHLTRTTVGGAGLFLATDAAGNLNIAQAFSPKHPAVASSVAPAPAPAEANGFAVDLDGADVAVERASFVLGPSAEAKAAPLAAARDVTLHGSFRLDAAGAIAIAVAALQGQALAPLAGPLRLSAGVKLAGPALAVETDATLDDSHVKSDMQLNVLTLGGRATLAEASVGPHFIDAWLPALAPLAPQGLRGSGAVSLQGATVQVTAFHAEPLEPGESEGGLDVTGKLDAAKGTAEAHLSGRGLDARAVLAALPETRLDVEIDAKGEDLFHESRKVTAHLALAPGLVQGQAAGPGVVDAQLTGDMLALTQVDLTLPGGRVRGRGTLSGAGFESVEGHAQIDAPDLGALRAALEGLSGLNLPDFAGELAGRVEIAGQRERPALSAEIRAPHLSLNGLEADAVEAHLNAARLGRQMDLRGQVAIAELRVADRALRNLSVAGVWTTPNLHLDVQAQERGQPLELEADLLLPRDLETATLSSLALHAAGTDWLLAQPATLVFRDGVALDHLELRAEPQRLSVSLAVTSHELRASVKVEALDLARLPAALLPAWQLSGLVEGEVAYDERAGKREGSADLTLAQVGVRGLAIQSGEVKAALNGGLISAKLSAKLGHGEVALDGSAPLPGGPGKLAGNLQVSGLVLDDFAGLAPRLGDVHATLSLDLQAGGDWAAPELELSAAASGITGAWTSDPEAGPLSVPLDLSLKAALSPSGLTQDLELRSGAVALVALSGQAPFHSRELGRALAAPAGLRSLAKDLLGLPLDERLTLAELPLAPVIGRLSAGPALQGTLSAAGSIHGTLRAPRGEVALQTRGLAYAGHPLGDLALKLIAGDRGFTGSAELHPVQGQLAATLDWGLEPEALGDGAARRAAPLRAEVTATSLPLFTFLGERSALQGLAELSGSVRGSLANPTARAQLSLHDLLLQGAPAGMLGAEASWTGARLTASLSGMQPGGGRLAGRAELPLSLHGGSAAQPLSASLDASGFDLAPYGPLVARGGTLRALAGRLEAHLALGGTWASPAPSGSLALSGGKLALAGLGQLHDLEAQVTLDSAGANLQRIAGKSGGGTVLLHGTIRRRAGAGLEVQAHLGAERLGVYASDRLLGFLTSSDDLSGEIRREGTDLTLAVRSALLRLPQLVPKATTATSLDPDIAIAGATPAATTNAGAYVIRLHVVAPGDLQLKAADLDIQGRADLEIALARNVEIKGGVFATGGEVNAYGRRATIEHAKITFGEKGGFGPAGNPSIDARATEKIDPYRLFIDVTGHPSSLRIATSSEPPLDKEKVGLLLVTGSADGLQAGPSVSPLQGGGLAAASALGGLLSEKLKESLGAYMPLDVLTVEPNRLEAGKHLTPRLYVGAIENLGVTDPRVNGAEIHANYKLTDHWGLDSKYGTAQAGDLDLQWTRSW